MLFLCFVTGCPLTQNSNLQSLQLFGYSRVDTVAVCKVHLNGARLSSVLIL